MQTDQSGPAHHWPAKVEAPSDTLYPAQSVLLVIGQTYKDHLCYNLGTMELSKILIVHTGGGLGDVLVSTPVIEALHLNFPQAQIDFLARQSTAAAVRHNPWITDVYTIDKPKLNISEIFAWSRKLREQHYDCALILWSTASLAFTLYLARIPVRVGQDSRFFYSWSYTHRVRIRSEHGDTKSHWSEVMLDFVRSLNIPVQPCQPRFFVTDEAKLKAQELLKELPVGHGFSVRLEGRGRDFLKNLSKNLSAQTEGSPIVGFHVGKGVDYSKVKWPVEHFACWAKALEEKRQARLVFTGSAQERPTVEAIIAQAQLSSCLNLAGQTDVDTMAGFWTRTLGGCLRHPYPGYIRSQGRFSRALASPGSAHRRAPSHPMEMFAHMLQTEMSRFCLL